MSELTPPQKLYLRVVFLQDKLAVLMAATVAQAPDEQTRKALLGSLVYGADSLVDDKTGSTTEEAEYFRDLQREFGVKVSSVVERLTQP